MRSFRHLLPSYFNKAFIALGLCWILMQALLLNHFGIVTNLEASKYIEQAQLLINEGGYSTNNFIFYSTEILLIAFCLKTGIGFWIIVLIQLAVNAISLFLFYRLVQRITNKSTISFIAVLLLICMFYYQSYNVHLFTESLFFSFSIIFAWLLFTVKKLSFPFIAIISGSLIILIITRPTGILFIPSVLFFLIFRFGKRKALPLFLLTLVTGLAGFYILLNASLSSGGEFDFLLPYTEEHIICGVPTIQKPHQISMPVNKNSVQGLWHLITNNDALFFRLAKERFLAFWGVQRSFYSVGHNLFVCIYFYSLYVFIIIGLRKMVKNYLAEAVFILSYIFLVMLTVLLSCDEWHNRFLYSILPFLLLLAVGKWAMRQG